MKPIYDGVTGRKVACRAIDLERAIAVLMVLVWNIEPGMVTKTGKLDKKTFWYCLGKYNLPVDSTPMDLLLQVVDTEENAERFAIWYRLRLENRVFRDGDFSDEELSEFLDAMTELEPEPDQPYEPEPEPVVITVPEVATTDDPVAVLRGCKVPLEKELALYKKIMGNRYTPEFEAMVTRDWLEDDGF